MSDDGLKPRHGSVPQVVAWTLAPTVVVIAVMSAASRLQVPPQALQWLAVVVLLTACVGQILAITKSQAIGIGQSLALRAFGVLCTLVSWLLLLLWIVWFAMMAYYATHPGAPMPYGGR